MSTTTRWSGTGVDPVARPVDPFATIPGAYDEDDDVFSPPTTRLRTVRDNAAYAWRNRDHDVDNELFASVPADLVHDYRDALDTAAVTGLDGPDGALVRAWRAMGYTMLGCTEAAMGALDRHIPDELYHQAWDAAVELLDGEALVAAAGLEDELRRYRALDR